MERGERIHSIYLESLLCIVNYPLSILIMYISLVIKYINCFYGYESILETFIPSHLSIWVHRFILTYEIN